MIEPYIILIYLAGIFWFGLVLWHHVLNDVDLWRNGLPKTHGWPAVRERGVHLIPSVICLSMFHPFPWSDSAFLDGLLSAPLASFFLAAMWWLLFDGLYNVHRSTPQQRFGWWHNGGVNDPTEQDNSGLDSFLHGKPVWLQAVIKVGLIIISITLYILPFYIE